MASDEKGWKGLVIFFLTFKVFKYGLKFIVSNVIS